MIRVFDCPRRRLLRRKALRVVLLPLVVPCAATAQALAVPRISRPVPVQQYRQTLYADYPQRKGRVLPLQARALPAWLSFDFELRNRGEFQSAFNYTAGERTFALTRLRVAFEARPTSFLSIYMQAHDTRALGQPLHLVQANMRDGFDLRQGYLSLHGRRAELKAGREELRFGSERIIGVSDWANNSRTFDAFELRLGDRNRIDLFTSSVVVVRPTSLDKHGAGLTFHGAWASFVFPHVHLQPFVLFKAIRTVASPQKVTGSELLVSGGAEVEGILPGRVNYQGMVNLQRGAYSNASVHAGAAFAKVSYTAARLPWKPRLGGELDYATGNDGSNLTQVRTYDQLYPSNHNAFGLLDLFGFQNLSQERVSLDLGPHRNLYLLVQGGALHLATPRDSVYTSSGSVLVKAPAGGFSATDVGTTIDASAKYVLGDTAVLNLGFGHFFPGSVLQSNAHGAPQSVLYAGLTYRFRLDKVRPSE